MKVLPRRRFHVAMELSEGLPVDEIHCIIQEPAVFPDLEDARDVLVIDPGRDARLVEEHVAELAVVRVGREDRLHGDEPLEVQLPRQTREPHGTHAALRENADQLVPIEPVARRDGG